MQDIVKFKNQFVLEEIVDGQVVDSVVAENFVATEGRAALLNTMFGSVAKTSWYVGLVDADTFVSASNADTAAVHAGWTEVTDYTEGTRPQWVTADTSTGSITTGATAAELSINAARNIKGIFLASSPVKAGTAGKLFSVALLPTPRALASGSVYRVRYTVTAN